MCINRRGGKFLLGRAALMQMHDWHQVGYLNTSAALGPCLVVYNIPLLNCSCAWSPVAILLLVWPRLNSAWTDPWLALWPCPCLILLPICLPCQLQPEPNYFCACCSIPDVPASYWSSLPDSVLCPACGGHPYPCSLPSTCYLPPATFCCLWPAKCLLMFFQPAALHHDPVCI